MEKLRLGVIGTGMAWNKLHLPAMLKLSDKYEIVAMADKNRDVLDISATEIGLSNENTYIDYRELLKRDDIDAVDIAVPVSLNYKISKDAAKAGKNIICEKPLAQNIKEGMDFLELQQKYDVKILIAENNRYSEENDIIKDIIGSNRIGSPMFFIKNQMFNFPEIMKRNKLSDKYWLKNPEFKGGVFLYSAVPEIAMLRHIFGGIKQLSAFGNGTEDDFNPYSTVTVNLKFYSGIIGSYNYYSQNSESQSPCVGFRIFGTKGSIYLEDKNCGVVNVFYNDGRHEMIRFTPNKGYENEFLNFYNCITMDEDILSNPITELADAKLIFDILDSVENATIVNSMERTKYILQKAENVAVTQ